MQILPSAKNNCIKGWQNYFQPRESVGIETHANRKLIWHSWYSKS